MASWMLSELFDAGSPQVDVAVKGGSGGVFQVRLNGRLAFDKAAEGNKTPDLTRVKELKAKLRNMLEGAGETH